MNLRSCWALALAGQLCAVSAHAASSPAERNWPAWRGPLASGVAPLADPPVSWSDTTNVKWKVRLPGRGTATPIIWEDRVFLQAAIPTGRKPETGAPAAPPAGPAAQTQPPAPAPGGTGASVSPPTVRPGPSAALAGMVAETSGEAYRFVLLCLDRATGKTLWQKVAREEVPHEGHHRDHGFASNSSVTDGQAVFAFFGSRGLHSFDLDGNLKWQKDLGRMRTRNAFGEGSSPALHENTLVVNWDHEGDDFIAAFDKTTGKELWRQTRDEPTSWSTPLIVSHEGVPQVVVSASNKIRSYDLATGRLIWECGGMTANVIPSPVAANGVVYALSGFRGNALLAIQLGHTGDLTATGAVLWTHARNTPYVPSPLLLGNRLYFLRGNEGILSCFEVSTGQPILEAERLPSIQGVYASPLGAAGRIYVVGRDGTAVVLKAAETLQILATNRLDEPIDASPAAAGRELFLRGHENLYCLAEK